MGFDWDLFLLLTRDIPENLDRDKGKQPIPKEIKELVKKRDNNRCRLCGRNKNLIIHHIIPNGSSEPNNLVTLCRRCHVVVHQILAISGKWKEVNYHILNR